MYNCDAGIVPGFKKGILKKTCKKLIWQKRSCLLRLCAFAADGCCTGRLIRGCFSA